MLNQNAGGGRQSLQFWIATGKGILIRYVPQIAIVNIESNSCQMIYKTQLMNM